ncbi:hypothetical protein D5663_01260 [Enterococcus faecalis]|nr:hypothetical protein [Enterococcus faecalis]EGO8587311.1 hypothetical protein [Enterococcus faecalis]EGO8828603.1 hypothetical protein [Enterococcus faecalis]EGO8961768.1 hypothetical protein [Enterococcus faecalis]EGO9029956.1 hypothetical protein [Enterococcus faecalis]
MVTKIMTKIKVMIIFLFGLNFFTKTPQIFFRLIVLILPLIDYKQKSWRSSLAFFIISFLGLVFSEKTNEKKGSFLGFRWFKKKLFFFVFFV